MTNPYETPYYDPHAHAAPKSTEFGAVMPSSLVQQVRIFGILNAVQGFLELLMGAFFIVYAVVLPMMMDRPEFQNQPNPPPREFFLGMTIYLAVAGSLTLVGGLARIVGGFMNWRFRGRGLTLFSLFIGACSLFTFYCAPTSIAMLVYGLIVMLSAPVKQAFAMAREGMPPEKILVEFSNYGPHATRAM